MHDERIPGLNDDLDHILEMVTKAHTINDALADEDYTLWAQASARKVYEISQATSELATRVAINGVASGIISRRAAADAIHVHSYTLQRLIDNSIEDDS